MDFELTEAQQEIVRQVRTLTEKFPDEYWREKDARAEFPHDFYAEVARGGWLGGRHSRAVWWQRAGNYRGRPGDARSRGVRRRNGSGQLDSSFDLRRKPARLSRHRGAE